MNILVTGGAGFIGSHIVDAYLSAGHSVVAVDNLSTGSTSNVNAAATFIQGDIESMDLHSLFQKYRFDLVNHQAARGNPRESVRDPVAFFETNVRGGLNVLEAARANGTRKVIYSSSGGCVYGQLKRVPADEDHPLQPIDPYGASKECFETYVRAYATQYGLTYTILRYANIYGPRQNPYGEVGVVGIFAARMLAGNPVTINGDGNTSRDYVYIEDCVQANVRAIDAGDNETLNIGTGVGTSVNGIFDLLSNLTGYEAAAVHGPAQAGEVPRNELGASRAREVLGWTPSVPLAVGLERTVAHLKAST